MHRAAPIEQRLRNTYFEADMVMRREAASEIETLRQQVATLGDEVRTQAARIRILESNTKSFPFGLRDRSAS